MADQDFTLTTFYSSWKDYQDHIRNAVAPLTADQLALRAAPGLRSIGENAFHIIGCRMFWFTEVLGEDGGIALKPYATWNKAALAPGAVIPGGAELAEAFDRTWEFMANRLARWSPEDMRYAIPDEDDNGEPVELSRAWVVWHVLEHDLHHGGEISLTCGIHGILAQFPG